MKRRTAQEQKQFENAFEEHCGASREGGRAVKLKEALASWTDLRVQQITEKKSRRSCCGPSRLQFCRSSTPHLITPCVSKSKTICATKSPIWKIK
jgi:hypothetical protein